MPEGRRIYIPDFMKLEIEKNRYDNIFLRGTKELNIVLLEQLVYFEISGEIYEGLFRLNYSFKSSGGVFFYYVDFQPKGCGYNFSNKIQTKRKNGVNHYREKEPGKAWTIWKRQLKFPSNKLCH